MPTYEYRCVACGHQFEKFSSKITDTKSIECPRCENQAERLISGGAGLLFKGSGFYVTDYRSDSYRNAAKKETGGSESKPPSSESTGSTSGKAQDKSKDSKKGSK
ncbi:MAG: zinc ribbon domain-containing protein [Gemmatimonadota bacterium]|nr:MAG: zinc ribbon domain-containing protein [Gemmatimonadota bacterium]